MPLGKTPILQNDLMAEGDNNKFILFNDALVRLEDAENRRLAVDMSSASVTLTESQVLRNSVFDCTGHTVARTLTLPETVGGGSDPLNRKIAVRNSGTASVTVTCDSGGDTVVVPADSTALLYVDGTDVVSLGGIANSATLSIQDESVEVTAALDSLNFTGSGYTITFLAGTVTVDLAIPTTISEVPDFPAYGVGEALLYLRPNATGTALEWAAVDAVANNSITNARLADMATARIKGRTTAGAGDPEDLTVAQVTGMLDVFQPSGAGHSKGLVPTPGAAAGTTKYLREDGTWAEPPGGAGVSDGDKGDINVSGSGATWTIEADSVTNAKLSDMASSRIKGRTTAGAGSPEDLTGAQVTAILDVFQPSGVSNAKGLVPAPGAVAGTTRYLREDGTWSEPAGGGGGGPSGIDIGLFANGMLVDAELLFQLKTTTAFDLPIDLAGSYGIAATASTGTVVISLRKNGFEFATLTFTSSATGVFSGAATSFGLGDVLTMVAPATADATLANISINLKGSVT